jgi:NAD(P)H dehydrogenase (quinone)
VRCRAMHVQVTYCHPLPNSYTYALFRTIAAALEERGHRVTATDLYREGFDPVMTHEERRGYYKRP